MKKLILISIIALCSNSMAMAQIFNKTNTYTTVVEAETALNILFSEIKNMDKEVQYYLLCRNDSSFEIGEIKGDIYNLGAIAFMNSEPAGVLPTLFSVAYQQKNKMVPFFTKTLTTDKGEIKTFGVIEPNDNGGNTSPEYYTFWFDSYTEMQQSTIIWLENGVAAVRNEIIDSDNYRMDVYPEQYPNNGPNPALRFCETAGSLSQFGLCLLQYIEEHNLSCYVVGYDKSTGTYWADDDCP